MNIKSLARTVADVTRPYRDEQWQNVILRRGIAKSIYKWYAHLSTDTYLISFPKCGRTWLRLLIGKAIECQYGFEVENPLKLRRFARIDPMIPIIAVSHDNDPHRKTPDQIENSKKRYHKKKVIFLVRDPRDVVVSHYFQVTKREKRYQGSLSDYIYEPVGSLLSIIRFYNIWAANRGTPRDFLLVKYEDLHANTAGELRRVIDFVGLGEMREKCVDAAVEFGKFEHMRELERREVLDSKRLAPANPNDLNSFKTREGKVGTYRKYLTGEQRLYVDTTIREKLCDFYDTYLHA